MTNLPSNQPDATLPQALQRDLAALYQPSATVPPDLDAEIMAAARARLDRAHRPTVLFKFSRIAAGLAAAAAVAIVAFVSWPTRPPAGPGSSAQSGPIAMKLAETETRKLAAKSEEVSSLRSSMARTPASPPGDANADGRVDILDALAVARAIESGAVSTDLAARAEMTGDGQIDQLDIDAIALRAVSLASTGHGGATGGDTLKGGGS